MDNNQQEELKNACERAVQAVKALYDKSRSQIEDCNHLIAQYSDNDRDLRAKLDAEKAKPGVKRLLKNIAAQLAALYNGIYDLPASEEKKRLIDYIEGLNNCFENSGIEVIYYPRNSEIKKDHRDVFEYLGSQTTEDKKLDGCVHLCEAIAFAIDEHPEINKRKSYDYDLDVVRGQISIYKRVKERDKPSVGYDDAMRSQISQPQGEGSQACSKYPFEEKKDFSISKSTYQYKSEEGNWYEYRSLYITSKAMRSSFEKIFSYKDLDQYEREKKYYKIGYLLDGEYDEQGQLCKQWCKIDEQEYEFYYYRFTINRNNELCFEIFDHERNSIKNFTLAKLTQHYGRTY